MIENEAKCFIQGKLDCMNRCDVFEYKNTDECENCNYCYSQGTWGNQKDALIMAIKSLEKQIPKKVNVQQWIYTECECGYEFSKHNGDGYYYIPLENKTEYCPKCGQKLEWE